MASYQRLFAVEGEAAALERLGAPNVCLFRDGELPIHGRAASVAYLEKTRAAGGASNEMQGMVEAGDLAYSYGLLRTTSDVAGVYLRVWQITEGEWRLFLDLVQPAG